MVGVSALEKKVEILDECNNSNQFGCIVTFVKDPLIRI